MPTTMIRTVMESQQLLLLLNEARANGWESDDEDDMTTDPATWVAIDPQGIHVVGDVQPIGSTTTGDKPDLLIDCTLLVKTRDSADTPTIGHLIMRGSAFAALPRLEATWSDDGSVIFRNPDCGCEMFISAEAIENDDHDAPIVLPGENCPHEHRGREVL